MYVCLAVSPWTRGLPTQSQPQLSGVDKKDVLERDYVVKMGDERVGELEKEDLQWKQKPGETK